jgi:hypothetical protein
MATVAVAHRLARIIFAMLRDESEFDVGNRTRHSHPRSKIEQETLATSVSLELVIETGTYSTRCNVGQARHRMDDW